MTTASPRQQVTHRISYQNTAQGAVDSPAALAVAFRPARGYRANDCVCDENSA
jgi:hypothetical protein